MPINIRFYFIMALITCIYTVKAQTIPLDPQVCTGKLPNGLSYYIRHNEHPDNRVVFYLANKVGSILEDEDQRGLAHFMEHMSFNGTKHFPKNELINYLQKAGVRFGADINAYTSFDETVYELPLPADDPVLLKKGLEIMHDWAHGATLDPVEINKERGVVLEEKRLGKGAGERMSRIYYPIILNNSRYANRIPIGTDNVLNTFKPEAINRFYKDWYRPNLQALIIVGDIDVKKYERLIRSQFAHLKNPVNQKNREKYKVSLTGVNHFLTVTDPEMTATRAEIIIKMPHLPLHTERDYRENLIRQLFNTMMDSRLNELQRKPDPSFLNGSASIGNLMGGLDNYNLAVSAKPLELEKGVKAIWRENVRVVRYGFTITELVRAKAKCLNELEAALKEKSKTYSENYAKEYLQYFLNRTASPGIDIEYAMAKHNLIGITIEELNSLAKNATKSTDRDILVLAPEKDKTKLPDEAMFVNWMHATETETISPYKDEQSTDQLLPSEPVAGKIIAEQKNDTSGIVTLIMNNGIKVLLKKTDFKDNEIMFDGFSPGGTSLYADADFQSAMAAAMIPNYGAGNYSASQLAKYLADKQLRLQISLSERTQHINGVAVNKDFETALKLLYAQLTFPRKDSVLFRGMMDRIKAGLVSRMNDPNSVFQDTISAVLGDHNIRRTGLTLEKINQVKLDKTYEIYRDRFSNATDLTFVIVGSFDTITIKPLLEKYLGGLPATGKTEQAKNLNIKTPGGVIEKTVFKGIEPKASVNLVFSGSFPFSFEEKLKLDVLKEIIEIRLLERLREDEGGVYSPATRFSSSKYPEGRYGITISFGCAPENVDKLVAAALDEIEKIKKSGPEQIYLVKVKAEFRRSLESASKTNGFWLNYLTGQLQSQASLSEVDKYPKQLDLLTLSAIKETAMKYLSGKNFIKLVLMPEDKKFKNN